MSLFRRLAAIETENFRQGQYETPSSISTIIDVKFNHPLMSAYKHLDVYISTIILVHYLDVFNARKCNEKGVMVPNLAPVSISDPYK